LPPASASAPLGRSCATSAPRSLRYLPTIRSPAVGEAGERISDGPDALADALLHPSGSAPYTVTQLYALGWTGAAYRLGGWFRAGFPILSRSAGPIAGTPHGVRLSLSLSPRLQALARGGAVARNHDQAQLHRLSRRSRGRGSQPITFSTERLPGRRLRFHCVLPWDPVPSATGCPPGFRGPC